MAGENVSFNLQTFLQDMKRDQDASHEKLDGKLDTVIESVAAHETRIKLLERFRGNTLKGAWLVFGAFVVFVFDLVKNHLMIGK